MSPHISDLSPRPRANFLDTNNIQDRIEAAQPTQPSRPAPATAAACDAAKPKPIRATADSSGDAACPFFPGVPCSGNRAGPFGRIANINLWHQAGLVAIRLRNFFLKLARIPRIHKIDRRAAKSASGHARAIDALLLVREIDHQIEFAAASLI